MKSFGNHINSEKEEQLKGVKTEVENKVKKILKLAKGINGNKDGNLKKKSEIIHLIEDFHQHYESLYYLYEDLRGEVKNNVNGGDDGSSTPASDSESYYSPVESTPKHSLSNMSHGDDNQDFETSDVEDTILKDKLTSSIEVKETTSLGYSEKTTQRLAQTKELEGEVARLKVEIESLCSVKRQWEEQAECKSNETMQMSEKKSRLEARVLELEATCEDKELLQLEMKALNVEKGELEEKLSSETKGRSLIMEQVDSLKKELVSVNNQKSGLELELKKKSTEINKSTIEKGIVEEKESLEARSLSSKKSNLEEQMMKINQEDNRSEELQRKISQLQTSLSESEKELSDQQKKFKACQSEFSAQIESLNGKVKNLENKLEVVQNDRNSLQMELEALRNEKRRYLTEIQNEKQAFLLSKSKMERKNTELTDKIADQQKTLLELGDAISKLKSENEKAQAQARFLDSKPNFQLVERKVDEMAEEFRKQFEDKYRILSRRIRVAEQLHVENKEWYREAKEAYEQENKELQENISRNEEGLRNIKDISLTANEMLISLDSVALKFEECNANFLNRISKASCELKFAQDWARRKNKALVHVKHDLDGLLSQLDDKEAEILVFREKMWKSENKSRELEKMMKKKEDGMLVLQEEKREAIRQLCVWIDYHRSRSDYYMKMLSEMNAGRRKAS